MTLGAGAALAQGPCRGDVDDSGIVTANDLNATIAVLYADELEVDPGTLMRADANNDGRVTAADVSVVVELQGFMCPPGPSRTPTPTRTATATPTPTRTPLPTFTPTQVCTVQTAVLGVTNGALTPTDCRRLFLNSVRFTDEYSFTASPNQAIRIAVAATGGAFPPYIRVVDSNGYFEEAAGASPIEFTATTSAPYTIFVTSDPTQGQETGSYQMTLSSRACVVEEARNQGRRAFDGTECPDPGSPSVGGRIELVHLYTFTITEPLTSVQIIMRQSVEDSDLDPLIAVYGPDGYEVFPAFQADDASPGGFGFNAEARFVATQTGTYTLVASGGGCDPADAEANCRYQLVFNTASCRSVSLNPIPATSRKVVAGAIYGDRLKTTCPAPLMVPGINELGEPEVNSGSDVYTFTAAEGDIISAEMDSDGDPQLSLYGPTQAGSPFIALNDFVSSGFVSQLAAALPQAGTYTLFAANRAFLEPPDPNDPGDLGDFVDYEAFVQLCLLSGGLSPPANDRFRVTDCVGFGDYPFRSFAFDGTAGQVVSTTMTSTAVDPSLRVLRAGGTQGANDSDPLVPSTNARVIRTLPSTGTYIAEVSTSLDDFEPNLGPAPAFVVAARSCPTKPVVVGTLSESFSEGDCDLGGGRRYDAYTFDGVAGLPARPFVVSVAPPDGACVLGLLPEGGQLFRERCSDGLLDIPVVGPGTAGFVIASDGAQRGPYSATVRVCALPTIGFSATHSGSLVPAGCIDAEGARADWILFRDRAGLVRFNEGAILNLSAGFATAATITDAFSTTPFVFRSGIDAGEALPFAGDLGGLVKIRGVTATDRGTYVVRVAPPLRRQ